MGRPGRGRAEIERENLYYLYVENHVIDEGRKLGKLSKVSEYCIACCDRHGVGREIPKRERQNKERGRRWCLAT